MGRLDARGLRDEIRDVTESLAAVEALQAWIDEGLTFATEELTGLAQRAQG